MVKKKWVCNYCRERTCTVLTESKHYYDPFVDNLKPYIASGCLYGGTGYFQLSPTNIQKDEPKTQSALPTNNESAKCDHSYKQVPNTFLFDKYICEKCGYVKLI